MNKQVAQLKQDLTTFQDLVKRMHEMEAIVHVLSTRIDVLQSQVSELQYNKKEI